MTDTREYQGAFRAWWNKRTFYIRTMMVLWAVALFFLMVATVASAAASNSDDTTSSGSSSYPSSSYSSYSPTDYLVDVRSHVSTPLGDSALLGIGNSVCNAEARGVGGQWATQMVRQGSMDAYSANYVRDSATTYLC